MDTTHRKIELQSPSDLQHLISTASLLARQKIDLHFPPAPSDPLAPSPASADPMRRLVEEEVQSFLTRTFTGVKSNVSINGLEGAEMARLLGDGNGSGEGGLGVGEETETFDHRLARRVQAVASEIEELTLTLANLRREAPGRAAGVWAEREEEGRREWDSRMAEEEKRMGEGEVEVKVEGLERVGEMRRGWEEGTKRLVGVKEGIGGVVGRGERAREGVRYLEGA